MPPPFEIWQRVSKLPEEKGKAVLASLSLAAKRDLYLAVSQADELTRQVQERAAREGLAKAD